MNMHLISFSCALSIAWGVSVWAAEDEFVSPMIGFFEGGVLCAQDGGTVRAAPNTLA